jgi:hypothetical protein
MSEPNERKKSVVGGGLKAKFRSKRNSLLGPRRRTTADSRPTLGYDGRNNFKSERCRFCSFGSKNDHRDSLPENNSWGNNGRRTSNERRASSERRASNDHWDLKSCIDTIESLLRNEGSDLSEEARAAIENLRGASGQIMMSQSLKPRVKFTDSIMKRFSSGEKSHKSSMSGRKSIFMTKEMRETWIEVSADKDDTDRQRVVHDVLEVYGGGTRFDPAWGSRGDIPISLQNVTNVKSERRSAAASNEILTLLTSFKGDSMLALAKSMVGSGGIYNYCPPEWNRLTLNAKTELTKLLSLENLSKWEFDIFKVGDLTRIIHQCNNDDDHDSYKCNNDDEDSSSSKKEGGEQFCPLLFVGWAILCAPMAQNAMEGSLEGYCNTRDPSCGSSTHNNNSGSSSETGFHYNFDEHLKINPEAICNFLREIERRYSPDIPYHNNSHAADVTQTLHCLFALIGIDLLYSISKPLEIFSLILAATFHDVGHPGSNNLFHKNAMTPFAMRYNDVSILENMHAAVGHSLLMGEERKDEWDVFKNWKQSQIIEARGIMIRAILGTDMSNHFFKMEEIMEKIESVRFTANIVLQSELGEEAEGECSNSSSRRSRDEKDQQQMLEVLGRMSSTKKLSRDDGNKGEQQILDILAEMRDQKIEENTKTYAELKTECGELSSKILIFLLHSADISNPTKPQTMAVRWAENALTEFFAQGDKEKELALPVSPLCDKETTKTADSQIGFLQFVVQPTFVLLGDIIPRVKNEILPIIDQNLEYWLELKRRESVQKKQEQQH